MLYSQSSNEEVPKYKTAREQLGVSDLKKGSYGSLPGPAPKT